MKQLFARKLIFFALFCLNLAVGCTSPTPTPTVPPTLTAIPTATRTPTSVSTSTVTPMPTSTIVPTSTPFPQALLQQDTVLYSGPGNQGYDVLAQLKAGTALDALGTFADFTKVQTEVGGKQVEGFVSKNALVTLPPDLHELEVSHVPWQPIPILNNFLGDHTAFRGGQIVLENTTDGYYDVEGVGIPLDGSFTLTMRLQVINAPFGSVKLLGIPEPSTGQWWQGIRRMDVFLDRGYLGLGFRDGTSDGFKASTYLPINNDQMLSLTFQDPQGKVFTVLDQNQHAVKTVDVTAMPGLQMPDGLFPQRKLYLGASSAPHSTLTLTSISVQLPPTGKLVTAVAAQPGLRDLAAQKGITIGTEFGIWRARDPRYFDIMSHDFNVAILSEFSCNNDFWRGRGAYNFEPLDRIVDFALQQGWRVRASHLVWGATEPPCGPPAWMSKGNYSRDDYIQILQEHVKTVVTHFKGRVTEWSIANEAISRSFYKGADFWNDKIGPDYIEIAFRAAREADPNATLIFNDDNNDSPRDSNTQRIISKMYDTVKALKAKGVPIDVVGMQMHFLLPWDQPSIPQKDTVVQTMKRFGDLGVRIYITELDVNLTNVNGSQSEKWNYEAKIYHDMMAACIESSVCTSFATWGVSDSTSWVTCLDVGCVKQPNGDPLMFDKEFQPKPAYYAVRDALLGK